MAVVTAPPALGSEPPDQTDDSEVELQATHQPGGRFFDDDGNIFEKAIEALATAEITQGCNPPYQTGYCPDDLVTRGQMAVFLVRATGYSDNGDGDLFTDDDGQFYENAADRLATAGVTKGCNPPDNDEFCGDEYVTRGQMAAFIVRAMGYSDNGGGDLFTDDDDSVFENAIDRLGTAGVTSGCNPPDNDRFCPDDNVTRGQMAAFLTRALELPSAEVLDRPQTLEGTWLEIEVAAQDAGCFDDPLCVIDQSPTGDFFLLTGWSYEDWSSAPAAEKEAFETDLLRVDATLDGVPLDLVSWPVEVANDDTAVKGFSFQFPAWLDGPHILEVTYVDEFSDFEATIRDNLTTSGDGYTLAGKLSLNSTDNPPPPRSAYRPWR